MPQCSTCVLMALRGTGNHFWSVNAEEQFYLLAPILIVILPTRLGRSVLLWSLLAVAAWLSGVYASIVFGVLAAVVAARGKVPVRPAVARPALFTLIFGAAAGLVAGLDYDLFAPLCSIGIVVLLAVRGAQHRIGAIVGGMSYPMYLNHWVAAYFLNGVFKHTVIGSLPLAVQHALVIGAGAAFSLMLYWAIDRQLQANRSLWFTRPRGRAATVVAYGLVAVGLAYGLWLRIRT